MYQVGEFDYVIPSTADNNYTIIYINIVLSIVWVDSPKYLCVLSETLTDVENKLVHTSLTVLGYGDTVKIPETGLSPPHTQDSLNHIDFYMDDVITAVQRGGGGGMTMPSLCRNL